MRVPTVRPRRIRHAGSTKTRCGGQERRSRHTGLGSHGAGSDAQLETKPPDHRELPPRGAINAHPFVSVAWILRAPSTKSLCPPSHICCDEIKNAACAGALKSRQPWDRELRKAAFETRGMRHQIPSRRKGNSQPWPSTPATEMSGSDWQAPWNVPAPIARNESHSSTEESLELK